MTKVHGRKRLFVHCLISVTSPLIITSFLSPQGCFEQLWDDVMFGVSHLHQEEDVEEKTHSSGAEDRRHGRVWECQERAGGWSPSTNIIYKLLQTGRGMCSYVSALSPSRPGNVNARSRSLEVASAGPLSSAWTSLGAEPQHQRPRPQRRRGPSSSTNASATSLIPNRPRYRPCLGVCSFRRDAPFVEFQVFYDLMGLSIYVQFQLNSFKYTLLRVWLSDTFNKVKWTCL